MEENTRLVHDCALAGMVHVIERLERGGIDVPVSEREGVYKACVAIIETYIIERNRTLRRMYPLGGN